MEFTEQDEAQIRGPQATYEALQLARLRNRQLEDVLRRLLACPEIADIAPEDRDIETGFIESEARQLLSFDAAPTDPAHGGKIWEA